MKNAEVEENKVAAIQKFDQDVWSPRDLNILSQLADGSENYLAQLIALPPTFAHKKSCPAELRDALCEALGRFYEMVVLLRRDFDHLHEQSLVLTLKPLIDAYGTTCLEGEVLKKAVVLVTMKTYFALMK